MLSWTLDVHWDLYPLPSLDIPETANSTICRWMFPSLQFPQLPSISVSFFLEIPFHTQIWWPIVVSM